MDISHCIFRGGIISLVKIFQIFSITVGKNRDIRERNWVDAKKNRKFFKNSETKTAFPGEKLGRVNFFRISSKMMVVNDTHRERNWMGTQWR